MGKELDINKVAAEFISKQIGDACNLAKGVLVGASDKIRARLKRTYNGYIKALLEKHSKTKSFLLRDEPAYLYRFYVPLNLTCGSRVFEKASLSEVLKLSKRAIVVGSAGSGKSMLMRHFVLGGLFAKERVPVFIELRQFQKEGTIQNQIRQVLRENGFRLGSDFVEKALESGHFVLLLDGFDEVPESERGQIRDEIAEIAKKYQETAIVVSSRPDDSFGTWESFPVLKVCPLNLLQACQLVERLPADETLKSKFLEDIRNKLFEKHQSFLSNPLLLSIMLLTYGMSAEIPSKMSSFYEQAYETLFQRHDALKGGYRRKRFSKLDMPDFARVFSAFSLLTYDERRIQFSRSQALAILKKAKQVSSLNFVLEDYLKDALQSVCLLVEDGLQLTFAHRSFQEYFVARFIADANPEWQRKLIERYGQGVRRDNVIGLLYEMQPELVEREYVIPGINKIAERIGIKNKPGITHFKRLLDECFTEISIKSLNVG